MDSRGERTDTGTETRKLQQVGGGTYTLSIPKAWADERDLAAGMELHLFSHADGSIVVRDADTDGSHLASVELAVEGDDPALVERTLRSAHTAGFETVRLVPRNVDGDSDSDSGSDRNANANANTTATDASGEFTDAQRETARTVARTLVGTDLLTDDAGEVAVGHLLDAATVSVQQSVVQLQFTVLAVLERATTAVLAGDTGAADRLGERREEADRLCRMVERHFARSLVSLEELDRLDVSRTALFDHYVVAQALEGVAEEALGIARVADDVEEGVPAAVAPSVRETADLAAEVVEHGTSAVLDDTRTTAGAHQALDAGEEVHARTAAAERVLFDESVGARAAVGTVRTLDALARTADCGATAARTALRGATRAEDADQSAVPSVSVDEER